MSTHQQVCKHYRPCPQPPEPVAVAKSFSAAPKLPQQRVHHIKTNTDPSTKTSRGVIGVKQKLVETQSAATRLTDHRGVARMGRRREAGRARLGEGRPMCISPRRGRTGLGEGGHKIQGEAFAGL